MVFGSSIFKKIRAEPAPHNTFNLFEFNEFTKVNEPCLDIILKSGKFHYEDFTIFKEINSIDVLLNKKACNICTMTNDATGQSWITFNDKIFNIIEKENKFNYVTFYTFIAFVDRLIKCNSIYVKFACATSPVDGSKVLSYNEASEVYARYKSTSNSDKKNNKSSTGKALNKFISGKEVNPLYEMKLCFNEVESLARLKKISHSLIFLSGTWNPWLLNLFHDDPLPYFIRLSNKTNVRQDDFLKLKYLVLGNKSKVEDDIYINQTSPPIATKFTDKELIADAKRLEL
jgi:hypothetical protein